MSSSAYAISVAYVNILSAPHQIILTKLQVEDPDVCRGIVEKEGAALHDAFQNLHIGSHATRTMCASLIGLCQYPEVRPHTLQFPSSKPDTARPPPSGESPIKVVHFSDTHVDLF